MNRTLHTYVYDTVDADGAFLNQHTTQAASVREVYARIPYAKNVMRAYTWTKYPYRPARRG